MLDHAKGKPRERTDHAIRARLRGDGRESEPTGGRNLDSLLDQAVAPPKRWEQGKAAWFQVVWPEMYRRSSLVEDVERLSDPGVEVAGEDLIGLALKYFHAYIYDSHGRPVPLEDVTLLCERFSRHRSLNEPEDDIEVMNNMRQWSFALRMLADIPKTAHILRAIICGRLPQESMNGRFVGLDLGAGTGILMLGQYILARRSGFPDSRIWGIEYEEAVGTRTDQVARALGIGRVVLADARTMGAYRMVKDEPVTFVSNETVAAINQPLQREHFQKICYALFHSCGRNLKHATFFPEALIAYSKDLNVSVLLARDTAFQGMSSVRGLQLFPQAVILEGRTVPLHLLGEDLAGMLTPFGQRVLPRRW